MADLQVGDRVIHNDGGLPGTVIQRGLRVQFDDGEALDVNESDVTKLPPAVYMSPERVSALRRILHSFDFIGIKDGDDRGFEASDAEMIRAIVAEAETSG